MDLGVLFLIMFGTRQLTVEVTRDSYPRELPSVAQCLIEKVPQGGN
jgi:hypothetical protein